MAETLEVSLKSVLDQLDERYEVIVIDDGSKDSSVEILKNLSKVYENLRYIPLARDYRRRLGDTRNLSIEAARGKYVILHIDADDKWGPYIDSFIRVFHELSKRLEFENFILSGYQIHMAPRDLLLKNRYPNVYYTEDRLLCNKLAAKGAFLSIKHKLFRTRIPIKTRKKKLFKVIKSQFSSMLVSFSYHPYPVKSFFEYLARILRKSDWSFIVSSINLILIFPAFIYGVLLNRAERIDTVDRNYRELCPIDINQVENKYIEKYGKFNLSKEERIIYYLE
ncbi:glycosyltransferase family 2 protein [Prochlorococcus sp. Dvax-bc1017]|nr:putative glycosyl transferase [Prochlorococcus marinus str. EQPAC1]